MITIRELKISVVGFCLGLILSLVVFNLPTSGQEALSVFIQVAVIFSVVLLLVSILVSTALAMFYKKKTGLQQ